MKAVCQAICEPNVPAIVTFSIFILFKFIRFFILVKMHRHDKRNPLHTLKYITITYTYYQWYHNK
jgi:hypothetical protein